MQAKKYLLVLLFAASLGLSLVAEAMDAKASLNKGIDLFGQDRYSEALDLFGKVMSDPKAKAERPEAAYWAVLAYLATGDQSTAGASIDAFVSAYPTSPRVPDLLYQRGRILYTKGDYEAAIKAFAAFAQAAPASDLLPSALYWSGECLYSLGRLEDAERAFTSVVQNYPASVKVEACNYRISLIGLEYRQRELLKLLTWSHEESLRSVEDFRRREKAYEASIALYQKQMADSKRGLISDQERILADLRAQVADLGSRLAAKEAELATSQTQIGALQSSLASAQAAAEKAKKEPAAPVITKTAAGKDSRSEALAAKSRALDLLAFYIERMASGGQPKDVSK
jgi:outer membrane protein assembly factor BamD (BamD/ComL family)